MKYSVVSHMIVTLTNMQLLVLITLLSELMMILNKLIIVKLEQLQSQYPVRVVVIQGEEVLVLEVIVEHHQHKNILVNLAE